MIGVPPRRDDPEWMDGAGNSEDDLARVLEDLGRVNRFLQGNRISLAAVRRYVHRGGHRGVLRVLDVGAGRGDLGMALVREARREGRAIEVVALDRDPVIAGLAVRACAAYPEIRVVEGDALDPPFADRSFDLVVANLFLHHFDLDAAVDVVSRLRRLATQAVLINDLRRHRLPHALFSAAGWILVRHPRAFDDGKLSVLRGFTPAELDRVAERAGIRGARARAVFPFRVVLEIPAA